MFKVITFVKRKPGLTMEEFVDQYERLHAAPAAERVRGKAERYFRRYLTPYEHALFAGNQPPDYDAIMEMWFKDRAQWEAAMKMMEQPDYVKTVVEEGEIMFDRSKIYQCIVEERESDIAPLPTQRTESAI
ncbi:EthD domain-containing protein [Rhizorhabdus argentea]|uniref:EthD domain-containing protein n=1 Tax=Rhizorhabdus argentea TaxID=1387174 RepID=UPI0030EB5655